MTDEQAAMMVAATALQNSELARSATVATGTVELGDAVAALATQIYVDIRRWNDGREHDELQERVATNKDRLDHR